MEVVSSADGTRIAFERTGTGPALVLVAGAFGDHKARVAGTPLATLLASIRTVTSYDRRGRGQSTDTAPYAVAREIEDLAALIAVAGGTAEVYGHSSGAVLALEAALEGVPIGRLALYEPPLIAGTGRAVPPPDFAEQLAALCRLGRLGDAAELFLVVGVGLPASAVTRMRTSPRWAAMERLAPTLAYDATLIGRPEAASIRDRAAALATPTLVIDGAASPPWARAAVRALAEALPHASSRSLAAQTHDVDPGALAPLLAAFFAP